MGAPSQSPSLTLFFVVEPPGYLYMACHLAASIRVHMPPEVRLIGYCPAPRWDEMDAAAVEVLRRLNCEIRPIETEGRFDPPYPHGNKILAALDPKDTDYAAFLDSDMLVIAPCGVEELVRPDAVGVVPSTSMRWSDQSIWPRLYGAFGMEVPEERITMTRDQREEVAPYFNAGLLVIDERHRSPDGRRFAEVWMETAQRIDALEDVENKRPYLDQMSMPIAMLRAGMQWALLDERYNYSIGGILRGKPLPEDRATILHYRKREVLKDAGLGTLPDQLLAQTVGVRRVRWIFGAALPPGIAPLEAAATRGTEATQGAPVAAQDGEAGVEASGAREPEGVEDAALGPEGRAEAAPSDPDAEQISAPSAEPFTADTATMAPPAASPAPARAPRRQSPDPSRARLACVTMVRGDHVFLQRWVDHYAPLAGRENLYVLRHGEDGGIDRIAAGTNIVPLPRGDDLSGFDRRRWAALSDFASGLTLYYNWVLCNDVDELVAPDPATGLNLTAYLDGLFARGLAAPVISPFAVEIVHTPATEPEPIAADRPILSVRRNFRINSNYAKPCLIRRRIKFSVGGHGSNVADVRLDPQLWLFHLRYMDDAISTARLRDRQAFIAGKTGTPAGASSSTWAQGTAGFERLRAMTPEAERAEFPEMVERMQAGRQQAASTGNWFFGPVKSRGLYRLPERFATLF